MVQLFEPKPQQLSWWSLLSSPPHAHQQQLLILSPRCVSNLCTYVHYCHTHLGPLSPRQLWETPICPLSFYSDLLVLRFICAHSRMQAVSAWAPLTLEPV